MKMRTAAAGIFRRTGAPRRLVMLLLSMLVLVVPLYNISSGTARAQAPVRCLMSPNDKGSFDKQFNGGFIVQNCNWRDAGFADLEQQVIHNLLLIHQLPGSDDVKILTWERPLVRAMIYAELVNMIKKDPAERTASEQAMVDAVAATVKARRMAAVQYSADKYLEWGNDPCAFEEPIDTDYQRDDVWCSGNPNGTIWTGGPVPPSFENLIAYGQYHVNDYFAEGGPALAPSSALATSLGMLAGVVAAGIAASVGVLIGSTFTEATALMATLYPWLIVAVDKAATAVTTATVGVAGATTVGSALAIVVLAIAFSIIRIIQVVEQAKIPEKIAEAWTAVQADPDLRALIQSEEGQTEIFAAFIIETLPDLVTSSSVPAVQDTDATFIQTDAAGNVTGSRTLNYLCWSPQECKTDANQTVRLSDGWFVSQNAATGAAHMTLGIDYVSWNDEAWTAWRIGPREFLHTRTNVDPAAAPAEPFTSDEIKFKDWSGAPITAKINLAPTVPGAPAVVASDTINNGDFNMFWLQSTDDEGDPVTYTVQRCEAGAITPACTTVDGLVSLDPFGMPQIFLKDEPHGKWIYRVQASDGFVASTFSAGSGVILVDRVAPRITYLPQLIVLTQPGQSPDWHSGDVTLTWQCSDFLDPAEAYSGVVQENISTMITSEGANYSATGTCVDLVGNESSHTVTGINIDKTAPTADSGGPYTVNEGSTVRLDGGESSDALSGIGALRWDLDGSGQNLHADPLPYTGVDGPDSATVKLLAFDKAGNTNEASTTVTILNVAPTATFNAPDTVDEGGTITLALTNPFDPSSADTESGFSYAFDCGAGDGYGAFSTNNSLSCPASNDGTLTVKGKIQDKDGGTTEYSAMVSITSVPPTVTLGSDVEINEGDVFSGIGSFEDPGPGDTHTATVDYGDGSDAQPLELNADRTFDLNHTYVNDGEYTVEVCVTETDDAQSSDCDDLQVTVLNVAPTISLGDDIEINEGDVFTASRSFTDPGIDDTHTVTVNYGDGSGTHSLDLNDNRTFTLNHAYHADDGQYTVEVCVTETADAESSDCDDLQVTVLNVAPTVEANVTVANGRAKVAIVASDPAGVNDPLSYAFDCNNDGDYEIWPQAEPTTTCNFGNYEGSFTINFEVDDGDGGLVEDAAAFAIATELCSSNYTGVLRYSASCHRHETAITLPDDGPQTVCASRYNGMLRTPANGSCAGHEISYLLPEDGPLSVCINSTTQTMRVVNDIGQCTSHEFGRVIAATEVGEVTPPRSR